MDESGSRSSRAAGGIGMNSGKQRRSFAHEGRKGARREERKKDL
jgi:hypothetical protein